MPAKSVRSENRLAKQCVVFHEMMAEINLIKIIPVKWFSALTFLNQNLYATTEMGLALLKKGLNPFW